MASVTESETSWLPSFESQQQFALRFDSRPPRTLQPQVPQLLNLFSSVDSYTPQAPGPEYLSVAIPLGGTPLHGRVKDSSVSGGGGKEKGKKMEEAMTRSYFCYCCDKIVNPIMEFEIPMCPFCQKYFIEVLEGPNTARDYGDNYNSYCDGVLYALMNLGYWNRGYFSKDAFLDLVLPGHEHGHGPDFEFTAEHQESIQAEADPNSPRCYPEPEEVPVPALSPTDQTSPPCSPSTGDSTPSTSSAMIHDGVVDFKLK